MARQQLGPAPVDAKDAATKGYADGLVTPQTLPTTSHSIDSLTLGYYYQASSAAAGANAYPTPAPGFLRVQRVTPGIVQTYTTADGFLPEFHFRAWHSGQWSQWEQVATISELEGRLGFVWESIGGLQTRVSFVEQAQEDSEQARADSGWIDIPVASAHRNQGTAQPQVRRIGNYVHARWGWTNYGMTASAVFTVGTLPVGYRPTIEQRGVAIGTSAPSVNAGIILVRSDGSVIVVTGSTVSPYYLFSAGFGWFID